MSKETEAQFLHVDLENVYPNPELNTRMLEDETAIKKLAAQIEATEGLLQPIGIVKAAESAAENHHGKPYELNYGFRRYNALMYLAAQNGNDSWVKNVKAMLKEKISVGQRFVDQLVENLGRRDLHPIEAANAFIKVLDDPESAMTQKSLADQIGWDASTVSKHVKVGRNISATVQQWCLEDKLSFGHLLKIAEFDLDPEQQAIVAALATGGPEGKGKRMTLAEFAADMDKNYKKSTAGTDEAASATGETQPTSSQRVAVTAIQPRQVQEKYLPHIRAAAEAAKNNKEKREWQIREDTLKWFLKVEGSELEAQLKPWEEELDKKAKEEAAKKEGNRLREKYIDQACIMINEILAWKPPIDAEDRKMYTLADAYAKVLDEINKSLASAKEKNLPAGTMDQGFSLGVSPEDFVKEIGTAYKEKLQEAEKRRVENKKKKEEKAAKEKADKEAAEQVLKEAVLTTHENQPEAAAV